MLDTGVHVSFQPPITVPTKTCQCGTFGTATVTLRGPVLLTIHIAGIKVPHLFYFIDADAPPLVGCDLMRVARLVIDVQNRLVWSRRDDGSHWDEPVVYVGPNPPVAVGNSTIQACVQLFEGSFLSG